MGNDVFANGREISCKAADGKSVCAFPDVCFTPPQTPATPPGVPLPYPNTGFAKDTTKGSKSVKITNKEVMLKNKSHFKTSTGDEAGCAPKKGFVTSKIKGKIYFTSWSMDIKVESKNVVRHMDTATHNHSSQIGNESIPWLYVDTMDFELSKECKKEKSDFQKACKDCIKRHPDGNINASGTGRAMCEKKECKEARECTLLPYDLGCCDTPDGKQRTPHHLIPNSLFQSKRGDSSTNVEGLTDKYSEGGAPCCCVTGASHSEGEHGAIHDATKTKLRGVLEQGKDLDYQTAKKKVVEAHNESLVKQDGNPRCRGECLDAQLDVYFKATGNDELKFELRQKDGMSRKNFDKYKTDGDLD